MIVYFLVMNSKRCAFYLQHVPEDRSPSSGYIMEVGV